MEAKLLQSAEFLEAHRISFLGFAKRFFEVFAQLSEEAERLQVQSFSPQMRTSVKNLKPFFRYAVKFADLNFAKSNH